MGCHQGIREVRHGVIPGIIINEVMIKDRGVPITVACKDDMWEGIPFNISVWSHSDRWEATLDIQGDDVAILRVQMCCLPPTLVDLSSISEEGH